MQPDFFAFVAAEITGDLCPKAGIRQAGSRAVGAPGKSIVLCTAGKALDTIRVPTHSFAPTKLHMGPENTLEMR